MKSLPLSLSVLSLAIIICASLAQVGGALSHDTVKWFVLAGTALWFASSVMWMSRKLPVDAKEVEI